MFFNFVLSGLIGPTSGVPSFGFLPTLHTRTHTYTYCWFLDVQANFKLVSRLTLCARNSSGRVSRSPIEPSPPSCSSSANETGRLPTAPRKNTEDPPRGCSLVSANEKLSRWERKSIFNKKNRNKLYRCFFSTIFDSMHRFQWHSTHA